MKKLDSLFFFVLTVLIVSVVVLLPKVIHPVIFFSNGWLFFAQYDSGLSLVRQELNEFSYYPLSPVHDQYISIEGQELVDTWKSTCSSPIQQATVVATYEHISSLLSSYWHRTSMSCTWQNKFISVEYVVYILGEDIFIEKRIRSQVPLTKIVHGIPLQNQDIIAHVPSYEVISNASDLEIRYYRDLLRLPLVRSHSVGAATALFLNDSGDSSWLLWGPLWSNPVALTIGQGDIERVSVDHQALQIHQVPEQHSTETIFQLTLAQQGQINE